MADRRNTMMEPPIEDLLSKVDSKFTLISLAALRGREINSYFNQLGEGLGALVPPQVTSVARKPLSIAFEEIAAGKVSCRHRDSGESGPADERATTGQAVMAVEAVTEPANVPVAAVADLEIEVGSMPFAEQASGDLEMGATDGDEPTNPAEAG